MLRYHLFTKAIWNAAKQQQANESPWIVLQAAPRRPKAITYRPWAGKLVYVERPRLVLSSQPNEHISVFQISSMRLGSRPGQLDKISYRNHRTVWNYKTRQLDCAEAAPNNMQARDSTADRVLQAPSLNTLKTNFQEGNDQPVKEAREKFMPCHCTLYLIVNQVGNCHQQKYVVLCYGHTS